MTFGNGRESCQPMEYRVNDPLYPILEFDRESEEIFRSPYSPIDIPERCVLPIYAEVVQELCDRGVLTQKAHLKWEIGAVPVYVMDHKGTRITVANPGVGAPLAAGVLEELIALGCRKFIACGSAGRLVGGLPAGAIVIADSAVRDEGTSYHYLPPGREIAADSEVVETIRGVMREKGIDCLTGKTWTTDGLYRETRARADRRRAEGCVMVDMECAALIAVARYRGVRFGQIFALADDVSGAGWKSEDAYHPLAVQERLFHLAADICLAL